MTTQEYVKRVEELARTRDYDVLIEFVERVGPTLEDQLTAEQVRVLRVHLKHADMVRSATRSSVRGGRI